MHRRWRISQADPRAREQLSRALAVPPLVATVLAVRGVGTPEDAEAFLRPTLSSLPDPDGIPGLAGAADRVARAVGGGETVWVYTDYDVDGVTSAALLAEFFDACGAPCRVRLPRRDREGYGLGPDTIRELAGEGARLVLTADCGITAVAAADAARQAGIDLVITDHHTPVGELPRAAAVANPRLPGSNYPDDRIAGVGVAWNLAAAVRRRLRDAGRFGPGRPEPDLRGLLDLVAVGTVADVAPLVGVNRVLVAHGLRDLNHRPRPGLRALGEVAGIRGPVRAGHIGFQLGPRLNAGGRMDGPEDAFALLRCTEPREARRLAAALDAVNRQRREVERAAVDAALDQVDRAGWVEADRWSLVVFGDDWHPGVVGLVASRVAERHHRPTVALTRADGRVKGSARSVPGLDLVDALAACRDVLGRFGGHAAAAGLELGSPAPEAVDGFRDRFERSVRERLAAGDRVPVLRADAEVEFVDLTPDAVGGLGVLEPFGFGNPTPVLVSRAVTVRAVRPLGRDGTHRRFVLGAGGERLDAVAWRPGDRLDWVSAGAQVDVAHTPRLHTWNGRTRVQLTIEGLRPAQPA